MASWPGQLHSFSLASEALGAVPNAACGNGPGWKLTGMAPVSACLKLSVCRERPAVELCATRRGGRKYSALPVPASALVGCGGVSGKTGRGRDAQCIPQCAWRLPPSVPRVSELPPGALLFLVACLPAFAPYHLSSSYLLCGLSVYSLCCLQGDLKSSAGPGVPIPALWGLLTALKMNCQLLGITPGTLHDLRCSPSLALS